MSPLQGEVRETLFGAPSEPSPARATVDDPPPQPPALQTSIDKGGAAPTGEASPELMAFIQAAIQKGIQTELQRRTSSWVSDTACSQLEGEGSHLHEDHAPVVVPDHSIVLSDHLSISGGEARDADLSDDEDLPPDQPSFVGLFKPQLFRSLLHKAKLTSRLGSSSQASPSGVANSATSVPLFEEPVVETEEIPGPKLFREVLKKQWSNPASGPNPNQLDRRLYNLAPELANLLQIPLVDPPVAALSSPSHLAGPPEENLRPEDKRLEQSLVKAYQASAWAAKS